METEISNNNQGFQDGNLNPGQTDTLCPENHHFHEPHPGTTQANWCYIYLHNQRIARFKAFMDERSPFESFVLRARPKVVRNAAGVATPAEQAPRQLLIGGIVFIQGTPVAIYQFFKEKSLPLRLVYDCATHRPAEIPDTLMRPLRQVVEVAAERLTFLPKPFAHYAEGHVRLRIVSGPLQGLEGCMMRICRDRKLVMEVGNLTVAIAGVHREAFEEVAPQPAVATARTLARKLTYLQEAIDRNLFAPRSQQDVAAYADNVERLMQRALALLDDGKQETATDTLLFLLEEMAYHFDDINKARRYDLAPISAIGRKLTQAIATLTSDADGRLTPGEKERLATGCAATTLGREYLFS